MSNAEKSYIETLSKESAKQRRTITTFSVINSVLLVVILAIVIVKTCI